MKNYQTEELDAPIPVPTSVNVAMADIATTMRESLLAMAVSAGLAVMGSLMEESVTALCGPKGKHDPGRSAVRHGAEDGSVTLGGRRGRVRRPRVRATDGSGELPVPAYDLFSSTEPLGQMAMAKMLAKLSTRRYRAGLEPVGTAVEAAARSTSKSAVSRRFVEATETALAVVEGSTENATLVTDLLVGLRDRGLEVTRPVLVVVDGSKALSAALRAVFDHPVMARCQLHKIRNVVSKLPGSNVASMTGRLYAFLQPPLLASCYRNPLPVSNQEGARRPRQVGT